MLKMCLNCKRIRKQRVQRDWWKFLLPKNTAGSPLLNWILSDNGNAIKEHVCRELTSL